MFWKIRCEDAPEESGHAPEGRFVLHRHVDSGGEHLDLRLECGDHLKGWRIDAAELGEEAWATEKAPHPVHWLDNDGPAVRVDAGTYAWAQSGPNGGELLLFGSDGCRSVSVSRAEELPVDAARAITDTMREHQVEPSDAAALIVDGATARQRATERLCGLGRELDGEAFDDVVWRKTLSGLTLEEIHGQLRSFEVRFDVKHPPLPVSRPDSDGDGIEGTRSDQALAIVRD